MATDSRFRPRRIKPKLGACRGKNASFTGKCIVCGLYPQIF